jgi:beta-galactosidase
MHEIAWDQFLIRKANIPNQIQTKDELLIRKKKDKIEIKGKDFSLMFDVDKMLITQYTIDTVALMNSSLQPNFWRPPTDNDLGNGMHIRASVWKDLWKNVALKNYHIDDRNIDGTINIQADYRSEVPKLSFRITYVIYRSGKLDIKFDFIQIQKNHEGEVTL